MRALVLSEATWYGDCVELKVKQVCRSSDGWQAVKIDSASDPDTVYVVLVNPWGDLRENICDCKGYQYRGQCSHQKKAEDKNCGWGAGGYLAETQTPEEESLQRCPRCGGPTKVELTL
jgi:hypothetical protein